MKILFDTSALVAGVVEAHPMHERALPWLKRCKDGEMEFVVVTHTLAELYAVLTTLPVTPKISPGTAARLVREDVEQPAKVISLSTSDYSVVIRRLSELGLSGGVVYDALIARAAQKAKVDRLLTANPEDFKRVWPEGASVITVP
jgi:predicted nucleic acid-binding protein